MATKNKVREVREARGLTQPQLALMTEIPLDTLRKIEQQQTPSTGVTNAILLANALKTTVEALFFLESSQNFLATPEVPTP